MNVWQMSVAAVMTRVLLAHPAPASAGADERGQGVPPIVLAARRGDVERLKELLDADPDAVKARQGRTSKGHSTFEGRTALHWSADRGDLEAVKLLLA
ncbi:MAG: ankyrin repeat domain-containing protein, partial [Gemmatimonadota bacterium]|nr:ankyrin repeat domain-containing protein [Gemmatimonadota bacterium]